MSFIQFLSKAWGRMMTKYKHHWYKNIKKTSIVNYTVKVYNPDNLYMEENTNIDENAIIMNTRAKVIFKKNSGAAFGLTAVTGNHMSIVGLNLKQIDDKVKDEYDINHEMDKDIVVEEDVWIGNHVILLSGVVVGRGSEVGAGSVVRGNVPPYAVVIGNPSKVVGFRFTPEEIIEHEKKQYEEADRLPMDLLQKNYEKYFLNKMKEIKQFTKI